MELILITGKKLKIMLTAVDMENYRLDCDNMDYDNTETRRAFWSILDEAKHRTGFDAAADRVMIQVYPCKSGGCEMFVTKLAERRGSNIVSISGTCRQGAPETLYGIYVFKELEHLLAACRVLSGRGFDGSSNAYCTDENDSPAVRYYLILYGSGADKEKFSFVCEYGIRCRNGEYEYYIKEHCRLICEKNAVDILGKI